MVVLTASASAQEGPPCPPGQPGQPPVIMREEKPEEAPQPSVRGKWVGVDLTRKPGQDSSTATGKPPETEQTPDVTERTETAK